jgi:hypothetical protein
MGTSSREEANLFVNIHFIMHSAGTTNSSTVATFFIEELKPLLFVGVNGPNTRK